MNELERFIDVWDREAAKTVKLLKTIPSDQYDFRPDPEGRSIGEMAWHLAEGEAYGSFFAVKGGYSMDERPPGMQRPKSVEALAPEFERVHREARERLNGYSAEDLDRPIKTFGGDVPMRDHLWDFIVLHGAHHRGQLTMMIRQAGGKPAGMFGPTREEFPLPKPKG